MHFRNSILLLTALAILLAAPALLFAQTNALSPKSDKILSDTMLLWKVENYNWEAGQWLLSSANLYTYNDFFFLTEDLYKKVESGELTNFSRNLSAYDDQNRITEEQYQRWRDGDWSNFSMKITMYDGDLKSESIDKMWYDGVWHNSAKISWEYDEFGNSAKIHQFAWMEDSWLPSFLTEMEKDDSGALLERIFKAWNVSAEEWENRTKWNYNYDESDNLAGYTSYRWNESEWVPDMRVTNSWDANGLQTQLKYETWQNNEWTNMSKADFSYTDDLLIEEEQHFNWAEDDWLPETKIMTTYDENRNKDEVIIQMWEDNQWSPMMKDKYYFTDFTDVNNDLTATDYQIKAYPNPSAQFINIAIPTDIQSPVSITIMTPTGKFIIKENIHPGKQNVLISLANIPSGEYLLYFKYSGHLSTQFITIIK